MSNQNTRPDMGQDPTDPSITNPATKSEGPCIIAEVEAIEREVDKAMPRVERAAYTRELKAALRRAAWAAEKLGELGPEEAGVVS
ncbi:MAG: hypothetical protein L6Q76_17780, partial [Polyangiaceae bacterium]|nr:hypothetical protein [Polyangiaceae bacterium]